MFIIHTVYIVYWFNGSLTPSDRFQIMPYWWILWIYFGKISQYVSFILNCLPNHYHFNDIIIHVSCIYHFTVAWSFQLQCVFMPPFMELFLLQNSLRFTLRVLNSPKFSGGRTPRPPFSLIHYYFITIFPPSTQIHSQST